MQLRGGRRDTGIVLICYSRVASGRPAAEPGHDLIGDRSQRVGPVLGGGLARVAGPEQHDLVPLLGGLRPEVHHELVHAHRPRRPPAPSPTAPRGTRWGWPGGPTPGVLGPGGTSRWPSDPPAPAGTRLTWIRRVLTVIAGRSQPGGPPGSVDSPYTPPPVRTR